jgi:hypothetical protein
MRLFFKLIRSEKFQLIHLIISRLECKYSTYIILVCLMPLNLEKTFQVTILINIQPIVITGFAAPNKISLVCFV